MKRTICFFVLAAFVFSADGTLYAQWVKSDKGMYGGAVYVLAVSGTDLFAGTWGGVWRRPLAEMVTSVESEACKLPTEYRLEPNYPNPFNPATTISFTLQEKAFVSLRIYDALGREAAVLVDEELPAGRYSRRWDGRGLTSGIYFCRLQAGSFVQTRKLMLLR